MNTSAIRWKSVELFSHLAREHTQTVGHTQNRSERNKSDEDDETNEKRNTSQNSRNKFSVFQITFRSKLLVGRLTGRARLSHSFVLWVLFFHKFSRFEFSVNNCSRFAVIWIDADRSEKSAKKPRLTEHTWCTHERNIWDWTSSIRHSHVCVRLLAGSLAQIVRMTRAPVRFSAASVYGRRQSAEAGTEACGDAAMGAQRTCLREASRIHTHNRRSSRQMLFRRQRQPVCEIARWNGFMWCEKMPPWAQSQTRWTFVCPVSTCLFGWKFLFFRIIFLFCFCRWMLMHMALAATQRTHVHYGEGTLCTDISHADGHMSSMK